MPTTHHDNHVSLLDNKGIPTRDSEKKRKTPTGTPHGDLFLNKNTTNNDAISKKK
jgi:hypothetical protein